MGDSMVCGDLQLGTRIISHNLSTTPYSDVYNLERMELKGYGLYQKSFIRLGKWKGGVPGLDWD